MTIQVKKPKITPGSSSGGHSRILDSQNTIIMGDGMADLFHADMTSEEIAPLALAIFHLMDQFPVTMRSKNRKGVRVESGRVLDNEYTGPVLEKTLAINEVIREKPTWGPYKGIPVICSPLRNSKGECVAAIGVIDLRHTGA